MHAQRRKYAQLVLANLHKAPVSVRAGQVVGYARCVKDSDYQLVECDLDDQAAGCAATEGGSVAALHAHEKEEGEHMNPFFRKNDEKDSGASGTAAAAEKPTHADDSVATDGELKSEIDKLSEGVRSLLQRTPLVRNLADLPVHLHAVQTGEKLTPAQRCIAWTLMRAYADVFNASTVTPTRTAKYEATIDTGSARPINAAPYRVSPAERKVIDNSIDEMLSAGVVRPSRSPWSSPVVLVAKKDNSVRFCIDYKKLNKVTRVETYPMPRIDETLRAFQGATCFSVMDMQSGYWQIPMDAESIPKTAFITHRGLFEFTVMPFGPTNAPGYFNRMMDDVLGGLKWTSVLVYIDDIIVYSPSVRQHVEDLRVVFDRLRAAGLTLKPKKCQMFASSVKFLGQIVSAQGIAPAPDKVRAIESMPAPTDKTGVKAFIGLAGYYRRFVKNFADVVAPLQALLKSDVPFMWGEDQAASMRAVKEALCAHPVLLTHPDFDRPFVLMTDASGIGIGAVLSQTEEEKKTEGVVEYASRTLTKAECAWSATEQEALAVKWACEVMRPYVYGVRFTVITDHRALQWVFQNQSNNLRLARWALLLAEYNFRVVHRPGRLNANADAPSRLPLPLGQGIGEGVDGLPEERATVAAALFVEADGKGDPEDKRVVVEKRRAASEVLAAHVAEQGGQLPGAEEITAVIKTDESYGKLYAYMRDGVEPADAVGTYGLQVEPFYCMDGDLLLALTGQKTTSKRGPRAATARVLVPTALRHRIVEHHHVNPECGHMSPKATYARFCHLFWWPGMWRDTSRVVAACPGCQLGDRRAEARVGPLMPIAADSPWDLVGIDLVGPFRVTPRMNKHILTMIDYYTRWVIFVPLRESKAKDVVEAVMENLVHKFGMPAGMISDRGSQFTGGLYQRLMARLRVDHKVTTAYHPQANGRVERVHRTLNTMLAKQVNLYHANWDEYVSATAFAVNTAWSRSTGSTPYELLFGRKARIPSEMIYGHRADIREDKKEYGLQLPQVLRDAHRRVRKVQEKYVQRMAEYYNVGRSTVRFEPGDQIKLYQPALQPHLPQRMQLRYTGPHVVVRVIPPRREGAMPLNYEIDVNGKAMIVNVARMRPYRPSEDGAEGQLALDEQPDEVEDVPSLPVGDPPQPVEMTAQEWEDIVNDVTAVRGRSGPDRASANDSVGGVLRKEGKEAVGGDRPDSDVGMDMADVEPQQEEARVEPSSSKPLKGWDNVLQGVIPPAVPRNAILCKQVVIAWLEGDDGVKRWWPGVVWDRPTARRPSIELQPFNSRDRKKRIEDAAFALVWWDPRAGKEEWANVRKGAHLQAYTMEVPMEQVVLVDLQWRKGFRLPEEALSLLGYGDPRGGQATELSVAVRPEARPEDDKQPSGAPARKKARRA